MSANLLAIPAHAGFYDDITPSNVFATAIDLDQHFSSDLNPDVGDRNGINTSTTMRWVSIFGEGDGAYDYFSFSSLGGTIIADIDHTYTPGRSSSLGFDAEIAIWKINQDNSFTLIEQNDDYDPITAGDGGSVHEFDSFIQLDDMSAGRYVVGVSKYSSTAGNTGWIDGPNNIAADRQYTLQIAVVPEPETWAMLVAGLGLVGLQLRRRTKTGMLSIN
jgi:hypothetical protein